MKYFILLLYLFACSSLFSQVGILQGIVTDPNLGEGLPFTTVILTVDGVLVGAQTDFDGFYEIKNIPEGTYTVSFKYVGYQESHLTNISIVANKITSLDIEMREDKSSLGYHMPFELSDMTTGYTYSGRDIKMRR